MTWWEKISRDNSACRGGELSEGGEREREEEREKRGRAIRYYLVFEFRSHSHQCSTSRYL